MLSILVSFLLLAGTLYDRHNRCCGQTIGGGTTAGSLTAQVGGFAVFECPDPKRYDREQSPLQIVQWTKDVSVPIY